MTNKTQLTGVIKQIVVDVGRTDCGELSPKTSKVDLKKEELAVPLTTEEREAKLLETLDRIDSELVDEALQNFDGFKEFTTLPKQTSVQRWMSDHSRINTPSNSNPYSGKEQKKEPSGENLFKRPSNISDIKNFGTSHPEGIPKPKLLMPNILSVDQQSKQCFNFTNKLISFPNNRVEMDEDTDHLILATKPR